MITSKVERHLFFLEEEGKNEILNREVNWDDNPIGLVTLYRTYLRKKDNGQLETWNECVLRVIEGMFSFQKTHVVNSGLIWDEERAQRTAMIAAKKLFEFKWSPPGRGLWMMGTDFVWEKGGAALNNCGFTSTEDIDKEYSAPFKFLMDFSMLGVGIGFDTKGAGKIEIKEPEGETELIVVPDSREGWVNAVGAVIDSYFKGTNPIEIDTKLIRVYGEPIRGFGGVASGPEPLIQGINGIKDILDEQIGNKISSVTITDIQNIIGKIVIAGNVRRCLPSDTLVQVGINEWKVIKDVTTKDKVYINDKYHPVKEVVDQGEQEVVKITLSSLDYLESTPNHRWFVLNRNTLQYEWVMAKDLSEYHEFMDDIDAVITYPVWSVSVSEKKHTTDLVVDSKDHAFIAKHPTGSGIGISHNTAEIAFSEATDNNFRSMKSWKEYPVSVGAMPPEELKEVSEEDYNLYLNNMFSPEGKKIVEKYQDYPWSYKFGGWRWASNNSVFATVGMDYTEIAKSIGENGEPGLAWLENMQNYSRMNNGPDYKDSRARGGNPCLEQTLESKELCCLVETYPSRHQSAKEFYETLKVAYLYAKTVTLIATHNYETNTIISRNRRIGTSQSGIIDAIYKFGRFYYQKNMLDIAYDKVRDFDTRYSEWLGIPKSIKTTSVKPSGSVSLLANVSPGIHYPKVRHGYRTMRLSKDSNILPILKKANYHVEPSVTDPSHTVVVYFPIINKDDIQTESDVTIWEQFTNAVMLQRFWADNQVSITISFKQNEKKDIAKCLSTFDSELKGVSLLPLDDHGYKQAPYINADKEEVLAYKKTLDSLDLDMLHQIDEGENAESSKFCDSDVCVV